MQQFADRQRGNARTLRGSRSPRMNAQAYALDRRRVLAAEAASCSHATAEGLSPLVSHFVICTLLRI